MAGARKAGVVSRFYCGVDAGTRESHLVSWDSWGEQPCQCWSFPNEDALSVLRSHGRGISRLGDVVVIESMDARGMRLGQDTLDTILWIGRFQEASGGVLVPRSVVKDVLVGHRKADDAAIRIRLIDMLGGPGTKKDPGPTYGVTKHRWQALAVAVTYQTMSKEGGARLSAATSLVPPLKRKEKRRAPIEKEEGSQADS